MPLLGPGGLAATLASVPVLGGPLDIGLGPLRPAQHGLLLGDSSTTAVLFTAEGLVLVRAEVREEPLAWRRFHYFGLHLPTQPALPGRLATLAPVVRRLWADGSAFGVQEGDDHDAVVGRLVRPKENLRERIYGVPPLGFRECLRLTGFADEAIYQRKGHLLADESFWREVLATGRSRHLPDESGRGRR